MQMTFDLSAQSSDPSFSFRLELSEQQIVVSLGMDGQKGRWAEYFEQL